MNKAVKMLMGLIALAAIVIGVMYAMKLGPFKSEAHWWHHLGHDVGRGLHHVGHALDRGAHGALHIAEHPIRSTEHGFEHVGHFVEHPIRGIEHGWHRLFGRRHHHHKGKIGSSRGSGYSGQGMLSGAPGTIGSSGSGIGLQQADNYVRNTSEIQTAPDGTQINIGKRAGEEDAEESASYGTVLSSI